MVKTSKAEPKVRTRFEHVPVEIAKKVAAKERLKPDTDRSGTVIVERKTEPYGMRPKGNVA